MTRISRRAFLRLLSLGGGGLATAQFLAACRGQKYIPTPPPVEPSAAATNASTAVPTRIEPSVTQIKAAAPTQTFTVPDLVVVRGGEPDQLVQKGLAALGGIERFVPRGANVLIKPNMCTSYHTYEFAATTNPWLVGTLVRMCLAAGAASVKVMDFPFGGTPLDAYKISGIAEQVGAGGGEMVPVAMFKFKPTKLPDGKSLKDAAIFEDVIKADVLINVPIAKHHGAAGLTLAMKNLMGVILDRGNIHRALPQRIADLSTVIKPTLNIIDAVRILTANGPTGGNLNDVKKLDTLILSTDIVAADAYATTLFGKKSDALEYVRIGAKMGLGRNDLGGMRIEEVAGAV